MENQLKLFKKHIARAWITHQGLRIVYFLIICLTDYGFEAAKYVNIVNHSPSWTEMSKWEPLQGSQEGHRVRGSVF